MYLKIRVTVDETHQKSDPSDPAHTESGWSRTFNPEATVAG